MGDFRHHAEIVGDEHHTGAAPLLQLEDQTQNLRLRRHVQGGGWFVGDKKRRVKHQRCRNHDALALPTRDLMGIDVDQAIRLGQVHRVHDLKHPLTPFALGELGVDLQDLSDLIADGHHRIECGSGS